jgi:hypothetical protein
MNRLHQNILLLFVFVWQYVPREVFVLYISFKYWELFIFGLQHESYDDFFQVMWAMTRQLQQQ